MKTYLKYALAVIALIFLLAPAGCERDEGLTPEKKRFLDKTEFGFYISGDDTFVYSEATHQIAVSSTGDRVRLQRDDEDHFVQLTFDGELVQGGSVETDVISKTVSQSVMSANLTVLKLDSDMVWLWNESNKTGYLMPLVK